MILAENEINQFGYILPVQGSIQTLELVQSILDKVGSLNVENLTIDFSKEEISFMITMIDVFDKNQQLTLSSLSLIKKILKEKN
jgi:hypothetical protein